jgi:3-oxoacyl-ACP reductase-like protein
MSIFGKIMDKIFHHDAKAAPSPTAVSAPQPKASASSPSAAPPPESSAPPPVDVGAVLATMAEMKNGGGNYQHSIVDLLKLLDLDSSLAARKELAEELNVHAGEDGSAEQNIALHRAVISKLAENGGVVPDSLRA